MNARPRVSLVTAASALVAVGLAALPVPGAEAPLVGFPITDANLSCPSTTSGAQAGTVVGATVVPELATADGSATLNEVDSGKRLARVEALGVPRMLLATGTAQAPVTARAAAGWAPALLAGQASRADSGAAAGLSSAACLPTDTSWWFVGASSRSGRRDTLLVTNPAAEAARFDVELIGRDGAVEPVAGRGIDLAGQTAMVLRLDAIAADQDLLAVHVIATAGRVAAALRDVATDAAGNARGVDYLTPAAPAATTLVFPGLPATGPDDSVVRRTLYLVNPGEQYATTAVAVMTGSGTQPLDDLATVAVPAHGVVNVSLDEHLPDVPGSLLLTSDQPIAGSVAVSAGGGSRDLAWLSATPPVTADKAVSGAGVVPAGSRIRTTVTVAAPGAAVYGTLTVVPVGVSGQSVFAGRGPDRDLPKGWSDLAPGDEAPRRVRITVPAGSQRQLTLSGVAQAGALTLYWQSEAESGPAHLAHLSGAPGPLLTGYSWWPIRSQVPAVAVQADPGVLTANTTRRR
ncbi:MAG: DUF5719 family protein [Candidatus Nanopelagicales bacterium]